MEWYIKIFEDQLGSMKLTKPDSHLERFLKIEAVVYAATMRKSFIRAHWGPYTTGPTAAQSLLQDATELVFKDRVYRIMGVIK